MLQTTLIGRQPIFDTEGRLHAYELLFRESELNQATIVDNHAATSKVLADTLHTFGLASLVGNHRAFLNIDHGFLHDPVIETIPPENFVLEILETVQVDPSLIDRIAELKNLGYIFALDDIHFGDAQIKTFRPLFNFISIVKVDLLITDRTTIREKMKLFEPYPVTFLAEKVESEADFEAAKALGFRFFQGYFFARPSVLESKKIDPAKNTIIHLIKMLQEERELPEIADTFKTAPELTINLCRFINSSSFTTRKDICSVPQALSLLGRRMLLRWLTLCLYTTSKEEKYFTPLMETAMTRAEIMSMLAIRFGMEEKLVHKAYLVGLLSLLDAIMHVPMEELFRQIPFHKRVQKAVLRGEGQLGQLLHIIRVIEEGNERKILRTLKKIKMSETELSTILTQSYYIVAETIRGLL